MTFPELRGLRFVGGIRQVKPEFTALLVAITVFGGAYIGEIVRGGFLSVDKGKIEAARALGLSGFQINRLVRIPLAVRAMLPALANQYVWLMKATTIGIAIGFPDYFMVVSTSINQSGQTIELLALLMGGFLLINYSIGFVMNRLNARLAIKGTGGLSHGRSGSGPAADRHAARSPGCSAGLFSSWFDALRDAGLRRLGALGSWSAWPTGRS